MEASVLRKKEMEHLAPTTLLVIRVLQVSSSIDFFKKNLVSS